MTTNSDVLIFPTKPTDAVMRRGDYDRLIDSGAVSAREHSTIQAAAQILQVFTDRKLRTNRQVLKAIFSNPDAEGTSALRNGLTALVTAGLLDQVGVTSQARYRLHDDSTSKSEAGFSLVDVVVTVAIIVALSVGGFVAYGTLVDSAKQGAVDYAASNVWDSVAVYEQDGDPGTSACTAVDEYNRTSGGIKVSLTVPVRGDDSAPGLVYLGAGEANTYNC
jgi:hypothetical protein